MKEILNFNKQRSIEIITLIFILFMGIFMTNYFPYHLFYGKQTKQNMTPLLEKYELLKQDTLKEPPKKNFISETPKEFKKKEKTYLLRINVNSCDSIELKKLPGIGNVLSKRIIKYRDMLGGFYAIDQLNEVYGLNMDTYKNIKKHLVVDDSYNRLLLNALTFKEILRHPYIDYEQTKCLVNYRNKETLSLETLKTSNCISEQNLKRLTPYLVK